MVATAPIAEAVQGWLADQPDLSISHGNEWNGDERWFGPSRVLAERAGLHRDYLYDVLQQKRKTMSFDAADKLLCACGLQHLWRTTLEWHYRRARLVDKEGSTA